MTSSSATDPLLFLYLDCQHQADLQMYSCERSGHENGHQWQDRLQQYNSQNIDEIESVLRLILAATCGAVRLRGPRSGRHRSTPSSRKRKQYDRPLLTSSVGSTPFLSHVSGTLAHMQHLWAQKWTLLQVVRCCNRKPIQILHLHAVNVEGVHDMGRSHSAQLSRLFG
jgi:hypothetical protein